MVWVLGWHGLPHAYWYASILRGQKTAGVRFEITRNVYTHKLRPTQVISRVQLHMGHEKVNIASKTNTCILYNKCIYIHM